MAVSVLTAIFTPELVVGLSSFGSMDSISAPAFGAGLVPLQGWTSVEGGYVSELVLGAVDACFLVDSNGCTDPVWALVAGSLPFGVFLDTSSGVYSVSSSVLLVRGNGPDQFTVSMTDSCGNVLTETYYATYSTNPPTDPPNDPGGGGTPTGCWDLGPLWTITTLCAYQGTWGLQRNGNGVLGTSDVVSSGTIAATAGQTYFLSFYAKGSGGADGTIGLGLGFYDINGDLISTEFITTSGSPTTWTQFLGNVTAPADSVLAIPIISSVGHLTGTWCLDQVYAILTGGYFVLSSIKHYWSDYSSYR